MPFTPVEGAELFYEVTGDGPDAIVFVHGAGGNHLIWYQQVAYFSRRYRCITYDQRSYGLSKDQSGEAWLALSRDLLGLLDSLEIPRAFLVAQSLGGFACFRLAAEHPDRVQKLVMAGTALGVTDQLAAEMSANQQARREQGRAIFSSGFMAANSPSLTLYRQIAGLNPPFDDRTAQQPPAMDQSALSVFRVPVLFIAGTRIRSHRCR